MDRFSHLRRSIRSDCGVDLIQRLVEFHFHLRLAEFSNDLINEFYDLFDLFMREKDCVEHDHFRYLFGARFDHHDGFLGACDRHVDIGNFTLLQRRVDDELAVDSANLYGCGRSVPRNIGDRDGDG